MNTHSIREKFGGDYIANDRTYTMGIDLRFTKIIARRFKSRRVLETCTGGGFSTIALAREAEHVITIEINPIHQSQAKSNIKKTGLSNNVTFILGDALDKNILKESFKMDAAFLDPDWAVTGPDHVYRFKPSNTKPPADRLLERTFELTTNVAIILPPLINLSELEGLPKHELQKLYFGENHELYCLYFGDLVKSFGTTELRI